jgi:hypothetical protein
MRTRVFACELLFSPTRFWRNANGAGPRTAPAGRAPCATPPDGLRASAPSSSPARAGAMPCDDACPREARTSHSVSSRRSSCGTAAASRRRAWPSTTRSQSPASCSLRRACLRGRGASLRARTLQLALRSTSPRACLAARASSFLSQAYVALRRKGMQRSLQSSVSSDQSPVAVTVALGQRLMTGD